MVCGEFPDDVPDVKVTRTAKTLSEAKLSLSAVSAAPLSKDGKLTKPAEPVETMWILDAPPEDWKPEGWKEAVADEEVDMPAPDINTR